MKTPGQILVFAAAMLVLFKTHDANANSIDFSTTMATNWTASAGGAVDVTPYQFGTEITVTSNAFSNGSFLPGGSVANFDGFWTAKFSFFLPAGATNASLVFSNMIADDRAVFMLNGTAIGATGNGTTSGVTQGYMVFTDGGSKQTYNFTGTNGYVSGSATSGFVIGGTNTLEAIVNNTGDGVAGTSLQKISPTDGTTFRVKGAVSFSLIQPSLNIVLNGDGVVISWPASYGDYQLETTTNLLDANSWFPVSTTSNSYTTSYTNQMQFFRLMQQ
jgi:hypothetical protein